MIQNLYVLRFHSYVESNEQTELTSKSETDSQGEGRRTISGGRGCVGMKQKGKRLMNMDNGVLIAWGRWGGGGREYKGDKW